MCSFEHVSCLSFELCLFLHLPTNRSQSVKCGGPGLTCSNWENWPIKQILRVLLLTGLVAGYHRRQ